MKGLTLAECVRGLGGPDGRIHVDRLHALALGDNPRLAMQAIAILLERGYRRPPQELAVTGALMPIDPAALARLSDAELEMAAALVEKLRGDELVAAVPVREIGAPAALLGVG